MAKYTVTAGCGHTTEIQLFGADRERVRQLDWMRSPTGKCNACYAASKRAEETIERRVQIITIKIINQLDQFPADKQTTMLAQLKAQVSEQWRLAPAAACKDPLMIAAILVLLERA